MDRLNPYQKAEHVDLEDLVARHSDLVRRIAFHIHPRVGSNIQIEDLMQAGVLGLIDAAKRFRSDQGASFETFSAIRIRGAMLDEVRRHGWGPRSAHRKARELNHAIRNVESRLGRAARDIEVANELGIDIDEYHQWVHVAASYQVFDLDELEADNSLHRKNGDEPVVDDEPLEQLIDETFRKKLADVISTLPEREALVLSLYYGDELNLREIGEVLEVSESRVSQIHSKAILRVKARLCDWKD